MLFPENTIHSNIIIENTNIFHNILTMIHTSIICCLYRHQFLSNEGTIVEPPCHMPNIEWNTTMQLIMLSEQ